MHQSHHEIVCRYVLDNKVHEDGTPMLANNISQFNVDLILARLP